MRLQAASGRIPCLSPVLGALSAACLLACLGEGGEDGIADVGKALFVADSGEYPRDPVLIALPDGGVQAFWVSRPAEGTWIWAMHATRLSARGEMAGSTFEPIAQSVQARGTVADAIPGGSGTTLAWIEDGPSVRDARIRVWRLADDGEQMPMDLLPPRSAGIRSLSGGGAYVAVAQPVLVARPEGGWLALWREIDRDQGAYIAAQAFDAAGAASGAGARWETGGTGCPSGELEALRALAYPGSRILVLPGGKTSCAFLLDGNGARLRNLAQPSPTDYFTGSESVTPVDTAKGYYLVAGGRCA